MCENGNKNILAPIAWIMVALTAINVAFSYFIVDYKFKEQNIEIYGSAENFEKVKIVNNLNNKALWSLEDVKKQAAEAEKMIEAQKAGGNTGWAVEWGIQEPEKVESGKLTKEEMTPKSPVIWKADAKYSIYDFTDLECPYCKQFHNSGVAKDAVAKNPETLNHIMRSFPLEQIHPGARMKAEITLCLNEISGLDSYKKMADVFFNDVRSSSREDSLAAVASNGFDRAKVEECLNSGKYNEAINSDLNLGIKMGVTGTPTIMIVNNETWEFKRLNSRSVEAIEEIMKSF